MTTATKTPVKQTWSIEKIQQEAVESMTRNMMTSMSVIHQLGAEAQKQMGHAMTEMKVEMLKKANCKTPFDVVKFLAEFEVNVLGSKIHIWGDDKQASMEYEHCACFQSMQKACPNMDEKTKEQMTQCWADSVNHIAKGLGFTKGEVTFPTKERAVIVYTK